MAIDKESRKKSHKMEGWGDKFESQYPKNNKMITFDQYLFYLWDYLNQRKNISLYTGIDDKLLNHKIPAFFE